MHCEALIRSSVLPHLSSHLSSSPHTRLGRRAEAAASQSLTGQFAEPHLWHDLPQAQTSFAGLPHWSLMGSQIKVKVHGHKKILDVYYHTLQVLFSYYMMYNTIMLSN